MAILKRKSSRQPITSLFNAVLLLFLIVRATIMIMAQPIPADGTASTYISLLLSSYPTLGFFAMIIVALAVLLWGAWLLQMFWDRFMTDMFKLREVSYQEALAIMLIIAFFFHI